MKKKSFIRGLAYCFREWIHGGGEHGSRQTGVGAVAKSLHLIHNQQAERERRGGGKRQGLVRTFEASHSPLPKWHTSSNKATPHRSFLNSPLWGPFSFKSPHVLTHVRLVYPMLTPETCLWELLPSRLTGQSERSSWGGSPSTRLAEGSVQFLLLVISWPQKLGYITFPL